MSKEIRCNGCNRQPFQIEEYLPGTQNQREEGERAWVLDEFESPTHYVSKEEGTYNSRNGHFLCTHCYIKAGMPSSPGGWVAP